MRKSYQKDMDIKEIYESQVVNTGIMSAPDASKISPGINRDSGVSQNFYTPNDYRVGENEEGEKDVKEIKLRQALKKIKEILDTLDL
jgi:hypothetical protein